MNDVRPNPALAPGPWAPVPGPPHARRVDPPPPPRSPFPPPYRHPAVHPHPMAPTPPRPAPAPAAYRVAPAAASPAPRRGGKVLIVLAVALVVLCATVAVVLSVAGGAVSFHAYAGPQLPASTVASTIVAQSGQRVSEVRCHDDLPGTVGASIVCDATVDGVPTAMRVTTTAVEGEHILFDYATVPPTQPT